MADIEPTSEQDFNGWYEQEHLIERMALPGVLRARRFTALEGSPNTRRCMIWNRQPLSKPH